MPRPRCALGSTAEAAVSTWSVLSPMFPARAHICYPAQDYGLSVDAMALRVCLDDGEDTGVRLLRRRTSRGRSQGAHRPSRPALLCHPERVSLYAGPRDDCPLCAPG